MLSDEDCKNYGTVKDKFDKHFVQRRNVIFKRVRFNRRRQEEGEPVVLYRGSLRTGGTLAQLAGAKVFTMLDANLGFWQIPLSPESALMSSL